MMEPSPKDGEAARADPDTGLEGSMWRLGLAGGGEATAAGAARLPERPGETNCVYYLRTGACGYGETCRYNHPRDRAAAIDGGARTTRTVEYPERPGLKRNSANYRKVLEKIKITVASLLQPRARLHPWRRRWRAAAPALHDLGTRATPSGREVADRRPLRTYTIRLHRTRAETSSHLHKGRRRRIRRPAASDEGETAHGNSVELRTRLRRKVGVRTPWSAAVEEEDSHLQNHHQHRLFLHGDAGRKPTHTYYTMHRSVDSPSSRRRSGRRRAGNQADRRRVSGASEGIQQSPFYCVDGEGNAPRLRLFYEYYMKNGSCKFGSNCKYNHPRECGSVQPVVLNSGGYPLRPGEKECSYYIKTGHCKFGSTCKFHHPEGPELGVVSETPSMYPPVQPLPISSSLPYPPLASWQMGRPPVLPGSYFPASYTPMMHPSAGMPMQGWNPYMSPMHQVASAGGQQTVQAGSLYGLSHQGPPSAAAYGGNYALLSSSTWPSSNKQEVVFPERPGQPECNHYMKTGTCKYGTTCKYNHPQYLSTPRSNYMLSPLGLPMRPGAQPCVYYSQHGFCKYGPGCKFDHPLAALNYSPSASSLGDMPIAPYPINLPVAPMAPSPSSAVLRPEYILGKDSSMNQPASPGTTFGPGLISKIYAPHMLLRPPTTATGAPVTSHGGEL